MIFEHPIPSTCLDRYKKEELHEFAIKLVDERMERLLKIKAELESGDKITKSKLEHYVRGLHKCGRCCF